MNNSTPQWLIDARANAWKYLTLFVNNPGIEKIVKDLLAFSKPSEPKRQPCDVHEILQDTVDLLGGQMRQLGILSELRLEADQSLCFVDGSQIKQALLNIIMNAIEAMKPSGGELKILTQSDEKYLQISIADTGHGIAKEKIAHIFDPFFTEKEGGTGLGLAITHSIVQQNGGKIRVVSEVGSGARFVITLPAGGAS